jgi:hypothetical protein
MRTIIAVFLSLVAIAAHAQPLGPAQRGYVFAGAGGGWHDGATDEGVFRTYTEAPGGFAGEWFVGGGAFLGRWLSVEVELRRTGRLGAIEPSRYFITYSLERRDTLLSVGGRFHPFAQARVGLEPVVTFDVIREESWIAEARTPPTDPEPGRFGPHVPFVNSWSRGIGLGVDLRVGGGTWAFVPGVRFRHFNRGSEESSTWPGGQAGWAFEGGAAIRGTF